jgi:acetyltransferase
MEALEQLMVRFSQLIAEQKWIKELDINPLLVSPEYLLALDARVVLFDADTPEDKLPKLAIRPYPSQYVSEMSAKSGLNITIRPIRPEDEPLLVKFHQGLSERTVSLRYLHPMMLSDRVSHERLSRVCHCDYDREITLVAEAVNPASHEKEILAAARMSKLHGFDEARISVLVADAFQGQGIGREMIDRLKDVARGEKLTRMVAYFTADNTRMVGIFKEVGFTVKPAEEPNMLAAEFAL